MRHKIIVAAPSGKTRDRLVELFGETSDVIALNREEIIDSGNVYIEDQRAFWGEVDLLEAHAAVVLDSGFMWPMPQLLPTEDDWERYRENFDDYLRAERESMSLWLSLLEILNREIPLCFNPQTAFANEALKPAAFEQLAANGISVAPFLVTNDPSAAQKFAETHGDPLRMVSLVPSHSSHWLGLDELHRWDFEKDPLMLQACESKSLEEIFVAADKVHAVNSNKRISKELEGVALSCAQALEIEFGCLTFQITAVRNSFVDFSASPRLDNLDDIQCREVFSSLWRAIERSKGGAT